MQIAQVARGPEGVSARPCVAALCRFTRHRSIRTPERAILACRAPAWVATGAGLSSRCSSAFVPPAHAGGMITETQIALVQSSFRHVLPIADAAGLLFYERVFTLAPGTRALFDDDIGPQAKRTMAAVKTAVDGLANLDVVGPFLVRLGRPPRALRRRT